MIEIAEDLKVYFPMELPPREQQLTALEFCKTNINNGKKYMLLNMPTGSGKSYFVVMFANWYKNFINKNAKFDILTNSKLLQDQYIRDFPFITNLKGRKNYWCNHHKTDCGEGKELNKILKRICFDCPYDISKMKWMESQLSITNFALFISLSLFVDSIERKNSNVLIVDEAHDFESVFCDYISTKLNFRVLKKYGFNQKMIKIYERRFRQIKTPVDFIEFIKDEFVVDIQRMYDELVEKNRVESDKSVKNILNKYIVYCSSQLENFDSLIKGYEENPKNWALDITHSRNKVETYSGIELLLQPIWGYPYLKKIIWEKYDHVIFMSATILNKEMYSYMNGIEPELTTYYELNSSFDLKKRPLFYIKVGKMTYNLKQTTFKNQVEIIKKILRKYKNDKGIIHTVNYEICEWVKEQIPDKRLIFHNSDDREDKYDEFISSPEPRIMVSPSMMSGIDLKNDLARFSIILKVPYPNISSNKIKSRQESNSDWYDWKTIADIVQCYGRTVRSEDDFSDTFILDESFSNILKYKSKYLPKYFTDSIKMIKS